MRIFISHSIQERAIAKYLSSWLEKAFPGTKCFCTSRPLDLTPSTNWFEKIVKEARRSDLCLLLLSPYSYENNWIHFEAGLAWGNTSFRRKVVPTVFGGLKVEHISSDLSTVQCLQLDQKNSFDAFVEDRVSKKGSTNGSDVEATHESFIGGMSQRALTLLQYGTLGLIPDDLNVCKQTWEELDSLFFNDSGNKKEEITSIAAETEEGRVVAVRAQIIPRWTKGIVHWKFGITLVQADERPDGIDKLLKFHAGRHMGIDTWTLYVGRRQFPLNVRTRLEPEKACELQIWLKPNGWNAQCIGVDSTGRRTVLTNDNEPVWRLEHNRWRQICLHTWGDGAQYQVDVTRLEVDRVEPREPSNIYV